MIHDESDLTGVGDLRVYWQSWVPDTTARAVVVISHGAGEHSGRYAHVAERLVDDGHAVYAIDHRGHGRSEGSRALVDRLDNAVADLDALVVLAGARHPGAQVFLLGHSMGATVALRYAIRHGDRLAGLLLTGSLAALEPTPTPQRVIARVLSVLAPRVGLIPIDPKLVSRDPAVVQAYIDDPLVHHGKLPARTATELADAIEPLPGAVEAITIPTLVMYGTEDKLCSTAGSLMLEQRLGSVDKTVTAYEGLHHEILNEPEQEQVLDDICSWLAARIAVVA